MKSSKPYWQYKSLPAIFGETECEDLLQDMLLADSHSSLSPAIPITSYSFFFFFSVIK